MALLGGPEERCVAIELPHIHVNSGFKQQSDKFSMAPAAVFGNEFVAVEIQWFLLSTWGIGIKTKSLSSVTLKSSTH